MKSTLALYQDSEGVVTCQARIGLSSLPYNTKFPVLLPREHYFARLVILKCHEEDMHNGGSRDTGSTAFEIFGR